MSEPVDAAATTLFHVEEQEVIYWMTAIDAADQDAARTLVADGKRGDIVGRKLVSRLVTNAHPVTDRCADQGCYHQQSSEKES